jgi:protein involved in polysaccharide export with SLBB domain
MRYLFAVLSVFVLRVEIYAQNLNADANSLAKADDNISALVQLAQSASDYPVTAGDVYFLAYATGSTIQTFSIPVDASYRFKVANFGVINAAGKTFLELKAQVEDIVSRNFPMSGVQFGITAPAIFSVFVKGEVTQSSYLNAWGLMRLSTLLSQNKILSSYASLRDIEISSANRPPRKYDLFKAQRFGDRTQDPYLRPGDVITINRRTRLVTVNGNIERPGSYQLMEGENLRELIEYYGNGLTHLADVSRMELLRYLHSSSISGDTIYLGKKDIADNYALYDNDTITVPAIITLRSALFVEGAVRVATAGATPTASTRITVQFIQGENYASLIRRNSGWFSAASDTKNAYIIRGEARIPMDLNPMLYDVEYRSEYFVEDNDTLIVPFRQYFITVAGAVIAPGRYPYIPDRTWDYYIALAGGFIPGRNAGESILIKDIAGRELSKTDIIPPETIITARTNDFLYYFNQYAPVVTTTLSIIMTFLALQANLSR